MKEIVKRNYNYFIIFALLVVLAFYFPLTGDSLYWSNFSLNKISIIGFWNAFKEGLISNVILYIITKIKLVRIIFVALIFSCLFVVSKNIINKYNKTLLYLSLFLVLVIDQSVFKSIYIYLPNFVYYVLGMLLYLIIISYICNDKLYKLAKWQALLLGIIATIITPSFTILAFIIILGNLIYNIVKKEATKGPLALFLGSTIGVTYTIIAAHMTHKIIYIPSISLHAIENVIPNIFNGSFLIYFITLALLLFLSVKVFLKSTTKIKVFDILSLLCVIFFSVVFLVSKNIYLEYISYILNLVGSYYIINKSNNSISFKRRNNIFYISKIVYILILLFIIDIEALYNFPIYIFDMLIILNIVDYLFPNDFMKEIWFVLTVIILLTNIYICRNAFIKNIDMNNYIKWHLSCDMNIIPLPSKYESDILYKYIPYETKEKKEYLKYYDIPYENDFIVYFEG